MKIFKNIFFAMLALASVLAADLTYAADTTAAAPAPATAAVPAVTAAPATAAPAVAAAPAAVPVNWHAVVMFLIFVAVTLVITYWAATRTKTATDFYTAGGGITGFQNGLAIAGDYMSAASFLGIAGAGVAQRLRRPDLLGRLAGRLAGHPFLMAERLRNLGKYTFADVASYRFSQGPVRTMAAIGSLIVVVFYLIAPDGRCRAIDQVAVRQCRLPSIAIDHRRRADDDLRASSAA